MPTKWLPDSANLTHLKHQAKDLLRDFRAGHMSAYQRVREFHPKFAGVADDAMPGRSFALSDAQLSIAREYGYASWPRLRAVIAERNHEELVLTHNDRLPDGPFKQALDFMDAGDAARLTAHLAQHPGLIRERAHFEGGNYFQTPTLLEFLPENPTRQERLPENAIAIAEILLAAGAQENLAALTETLGLAASGRVCREAGVQGPLLRLLCKHGADPATAMHTALAHEEFDAARVLIDCGAALDLPAAAALDERAAVARLAVGAGEGALQLALALAANAGRTEVVQSLLAAGADPNRYNPPGGHSHCTPLHSAVAMGRLDTVKALVDGGADLSIPDIHNGSTPLGWAAYLGQDEIAAYLKSLG
ncbi:ankyrin repeat domain-containing protein [Pacificoceanicola onchidii]|uniref:ankyrin repeat domain-containing protein n=1 Tax=Pacificoceanicola onchidii TaxID=2562685 RepID=UPI0010A64CA1|nr:ankyrin repeat domain-containing protein [Pacificoceanicola onchidii]